MFARCWGSGGLPVLGGGATPLVWADQPERATAKHTNDTKEAADKSRPWPIMAKMAMLREERDKEREFL